MSCSGHRRPRQALARISSIAHDENRADVNSLRHDVSLYASDEVRAYVGRLRRALARIEKAASEGLTDA